MATSLSTLKNLVRNKLRANYKDVSALNSALNATDNTALITIGHYDRFSGGDLIEIDSEVMRVDEHPLTKTFLGSALNNSDTYMRFDSVTDFSAGYLFRIQDEILMATAVSASVYVSATRGMRGTEPSAYNYNTPIQLVDAMRLTRGFQGSTAATHNNGVSVNVVDNWSSQDITQALNDAIHYMRPMLYKDVRMDSKAWGNTRSQARIGSDNNATYVSEWTGSNDATTPVLDTANAIVGAGCIDFGINTATSGNTTADYEILASNAVDARSAEYINFWLHIQDLEDSSGEPIFGKNLLGVRVGSNSANYYEFFVTRDELVEGDNFISVPYKAYFQSGTVVNSATQWTKLTFLENVYNPTNVASGNIRLDNLHLSPFPYTTTKNRIALPKNVFYIGEINMYPSLGSNTFEKLTDFAVREVGNSANDRFYDIQFENTHPVGLPLELVGGKFFEFDSDSNLDTPVEYDEFMVEYACMRLLEDRMNEVLRFDRYSARMNLENATQLEYNRTINQYRDRIADFMTHHAKSLDAQFINFGQNFGDYTNNPTL